MFERFTDSARHAVIEAQTQARRLRSRDIRTCHLLLALAGSDGATGRALRERGVIPAAVEHQIGLVNTRGPARPDAERALSAEDAAALAAVGIDLDAIRASVEARFGQGALDRARGAAGRTGRLRRLLRRVDGHRAGGHLPFAPGAKKTLELSLREAVRLGDKRLGEAHIALGLLRAGDVETDAILAALDVDTRALRAALEAPERRAA